MRRSEEKRSEVKRSGGIVITYNLYSCIVTVCAEWCEVLHGAVGDVI